MNIKTVNQDIECLTKALQLVEKTDNYLHFKKSALILELCDAINTLKEKRDNQTKFILKP
jgi:hypothetical protein